MFTKLLLILVTLCSFVSAQAAYIPFPVTSGTDRQRVEYVRVTTICSTAGPCTIAQSTSGILSTELISGQGFYRVTFVTGTFTTIPVCYYTLTGVGGGGGFNTFPIEDTTTTGKTEFEVKTTSGSNSNVPYAVVCIGTR